jgi:hypothetical protein
MYKATQNQYDKAAAFHAGKKAWREASGSERDMEELIKEIAQFLSVQSGGDLSPAEIRQEILAKGEEALAPL